MDKIKELREAMAVVDRQEFSAEWVLENERFRTLSADYIRSILNSPDEAAVERAARAVFKGQGYPPACYGGNLWQNKTQRARLIAAAALTAALGVAAPDGGRS